MIELNLPNVITIGLIGAAVYLAMQAWEKRKMPVKAPESV